MKRIALLLLSIAPVALIAQVNDMFYVPKKAVKQENVAKMLSTGTATDNDWGVADNGNTRDVDEYNRRGTATIDAGNVEALLQQQESYEYEYEDVTDDYNYSTRIVRFHSPTTVVVSSPWYYDVYPTLGCYNYYDYCYDGFWDWSFGWNSHYGWRIGAGWHWPYSSWHWGGVHHHHHHPHYVAPPMHRVRHHSNSVSLANRGGSGVRRPVGSAVGDKRPATQVNDRGGRRVVNGEAVRGGSGVRRPVGSATSDRRPAAQVNEKGNKQGTNKESVRGSGSRRERAEGSSSSTYNRRSSTSVRRSSDDGGSNRSSVGSSRGGSSRSGGSAPSRGGTSRGGRR